jgi:hypothetical protein
MSVTRATTATRVNSAGLVELVPYNLVQYSEQFDNAAWTKARGSVTANATIAPNGTTTADKFVPDTQANPHFIYQSASNLSTGERYTSSVYAKISEWNSVAIFRMDSSVGVSFRLDTQVATVLIGAPVSYSITSVGSGWFRLDVCFAAGSASDGVQIRVGNNSSYGDSGNNSDGLFLWGAQLVEGSVAKDYQKTETRLNIPRLDYSNGTCPSLLVEPQRTNLALYSSSFDNAAWTKVQGSGGSLPIITANYGISPDGTQNADRIQLTRTSASFSYSYVYQQFTATIGQTYTWSVWLKSLSGTPSVALTYNGSVYSNIVTLTNEWERYEFTTTAAGTGCQVTFLLYEFLPSTSLTADFLAYGFQLEAGAYPTSYIPTQGSTVTRNADVISKTGISSLIGQTEGVIFIDAYRTQKSVNYQALIGLGNGTSSSQMMEFFYRSSNELTVGVYNSGQQFVNNTVIANGRHKIALAYKANDFALYIDGVLIASDTSGTVPTMNQLNIGGFNYASGDEYADGINAVALWKTRLTNTQLAQLTTI